MVKFKMSVLKLMTNMKMHMAWLNNCFVWWLIYAMSYKCVFVAKTRKGATRKPAKWWLFRVFAWQPFALSCKRTTLFMCCHFASCFSYLCLAGPKSPFGLFSRCDHSPRQAKIRHIYKWRVFAFHLSFFRLAGRKVATRDKHDNTKWHKSATIKYKCCTLA